MVLLVPRARVTLLSAALLPLAWCWRAGAPTAAGAASTQLRTGRRVSSGLEDQSPRPATSPAAAFDHERLASPRGTTNPNSTLPSPLTLVGGNLSEGLPTFQHFYTQHSGRGLNKWNNALEAYQRHLAHLAGQYVALGEIGVQSGGSIDMWHSILGPSCKVYGIDINPQVRQFEDATTSIVIGDQADVRMWQNFFGSVVQGPLNVLIDDGGHEANQMLTTLMQVFDHLTSNGVIAIEDIHGGGYLYPFFLPAANFLGYKFGKGQLSSVDMYPFLLIAQREEALPVQFSGSFGVVNTIEAVWTEAQKHPGGYVILENPNWGPFLTSSALTNFFTAFSALHGSNWYSTPEGCDRTPAHVCSVTVVPDQAQALIKGIHIYPSRLVAEVVSGPVTIQAVRKGSAWLPY